MCCCYCYFGYILDFLLHYFIRGIKLQEAVALRCRRRFLNPRRRTKVLRTGDKTSKKAKVVVCNSGHFLFYKFKADIFSIIPTENTCFFVLLFSLCLVQQPILLSSDCFFKSCIYISAEVFFTNSVIEA